MEQSLHERFIAKLEEKYGPWDKVTSRFGAASFGEVSQELSISPSQFSKLIYGTATEGMYRRSIENIHRLIDKESIRKELEAARAENQRLKDQLDDRPELPTPSRRPVALWLGLAVLLSAAVGYWFGGFSQPALVPTTPSEHPLSPFFDKDYTANFRSPYLDISEVQEYCPGSAFEGEWELAEPYKLPLPGMKRPGLYYLAKSADVRLKCSRFDTLREGKGRVLYGYEYLVNEIWLDTKHTPLSPRYFDKERKRFTEEFEALDFEADPRFKKVATIRSFFTDRLSIYPDSIVRNGEPCGRFATEIDQELVEMHEIDVKYILKRVLGDLTVATCTTIDNPFTDPNDLTEGESVLAFDCLYTIQYENLGIGGGYPYKKGYRLVKQNYSDNLVCE